MTSQTILRIPKAHRQYAVEHGARYDSAQHVWYVVGDVPPALTEYVPRARRVRDYTKETVPSCPNCGRAMIWIDADVPFWGCARYRNAGCRSTHPRGYTRHMAATSSLPNAISNDPTKPSTFARKIHLTRLLSLLHQHLKGNDTILDWLNARRAELDGKSALESMDTLEGFRRVEKFISEAFLSADN